MSFEQFSFTGKIASAIQAVGYTTPTPIQQQAIPIILEGKDVLGLAQTGTGKTAAFVLPMLQRFSQSSLRQPRGLIVAPTRELAEQINQTIVDLGQQSKIRSITIYGGVGKAAQLDGLRRGCDIIVACPGRLLDLINDGVVNLTRIEVLVLDEADRMCDMGFLPDIRRLLKFVPKERQTLFFSATMPTDIRELADEILHNPVTVQVDMIAPAKTVSHALYPITDGLKNRLLFSLLKQTTTERVLIFTRTKRRARNLALDLEGEGYRVAALQGNMAQNRRQEAIDGFREGDYDILVATDIAARGIDVSSISHVINYDMPDTVDAYTHRIGRTGRAAQTGEAFTFTAPADEEMVREIEKVLGKRIERRRLEGFNYNGFNPEQPAPRVSGQAAQSHRGAPARPSRAQPLRTQPERVRVGIHPPISNSPKPKPPKIEQPKPAQPAKGQAQKNKKRKVPVTVLTIRPEEWMPLSPGDRVRETVSIPVIASSLEAVRESVRQPTQQSVQQSAPARPKVSVKPTAPKVSVVEKSSPINRPAKSAPKQPLKSVSLRTLRHRFFRHQQDEVEYPEAPKQHD